MTLATSTIVTRLVSLLQASGKFNSVNGHEPKKAPGKGLTAAVWCDSISPSGANSGLAATTAVVTYMCRLYSPMIAEPQDMIDPELVDAADFILGQLTGAFTLGGNVRNIDLLGQTGSMLNAQAGYVQVDQTMFRVVDISIPCIVNDAWSQTA